MMSYILRPLFSPVNKIFIPGPGNSSLCRGTFPAGLSRQIRIHCPPVNDRLAPFSTDPLYIRLSPEEKALLENRAETCRLSFQDLKNLLDMAADLRSWGRGSLTELWKDPPEQLTGKDRKHWSLARIRSLWEELKLRGPDYREVSGPPAPRQEPLRLNEEEAPEELILLGRCPVASEKTRCCSLLTLDAVQSCGFDCSYCTIQSFYSREGIRFHSNLEEKLRRLEKELDPREVYHIGTGQSSDSLLWGNRGDLLASLWSLARRNPNVILELKTKSDNIAWVLDNPPPANMLLTWSLNTGTIIRHEERGTASLERRLAAARAAADRGILVGFHFHPMVRYAGWEEEYRELFRELLGRFRPEETALVSLGTLTYIKPVIRKIRRRGGPTRILQLPLEETAGKFSYPHEMKRELFSLAWEELRPWHDRVFIYLCMEEPSLWKEVMNREFEDNDSFEKAMKAAYLEKILANSSRNLL